jgi:hypothetical protein
MAPALYDSDDGTPAYNQRWGPQNGTWKLKLNTGGYRTRKAPDSTNFTVIISPDPFVWFRGTANADISSHAAGTASIYYRADATNYTDTTADTPSGSVFNGLDDTVTSGSWVICNWDTYVTGGNVVEGWIIIQSDFAC